MNNPFRTVKVLKVKFEGIIRSNGFNLGSKLSENHVIEKDNKRSNFRFCFEQENPKLL